MTLRDYFAAKAMQAIIQDVLRNERADTADQTPSLAYAFADAMLEAREQ